MATEDRLGGVLMGIVVRRIRRAIGWGGLCYVVLAVVCIVALLSHALPVSNVEAWRLILLPAAGLAVLGYRMRGYQKPQVTRSYQEVLTPLLASAEEFCLVLRPFGQDGETFLRKYRRSKRDIRHVDQFPYADILTMEQVIARSARQALRLDTYALVDQNRKLAPPGPVYVRAPDESWQEAVLALVQRAHSIILWLAPGQDLRASFHWEVEQIVQARRQFRTIIVLPPPDQQADAYQQAVNQATVLLAAMESDTGKLADADPVYVRHYQDMLADNTLMAKFEAAEGGSGAVLRRWYATGRRKWWGGKMPLDVSAYEKGLVFLITRTEGELAGQPFTARYPSRQPGDQDRTAAERQ
jgi:hypothetical protein